MAAVDTVLVAPAPYQPTQRLTAGRLTLLLWTDVMYRATGYTSEIRVHDPPTGPGPDAEVWARRRQVLGVRIADGARPPDPLEQGEVLTALDRAGLLLDLRTIGGPTYVDPTRYGVPLRRLSDVDGRPTSLAGALAGLLPYGGAFDQIVLVHDPRVTADYQVLQRVLEACLGSKVHRIVAGGRADEGPHAADRTDTPWHLDDLLIELEASCAPSVLRLGLRMLVLARPGAEERHAYHSDTVSRCLQQAEDVIEAAVDGDGLEPERLVRQHLALHGTAAWVDPHLLTRRLIARHRPPLRRTVLTGIYL